MIEMKVGLVKEDNQIIGAFVMIVPDNGIPVILGSVDEPLEIQVMNKEALIKGLSCLPQEFLGIVNQNSTYEQLQPQNIEELQEQFIQMGLIE